MKLITLNLIAYRIICIGLILFMTIGSYAILTHRYYITALIGFIASVSIGYLVTREPTRKTWLAVIVIFFITMLIIGSNQLM